MEAKIVKQNQFEDKDGNVFRNFKLQHEWDFFWLSEKTFKAQTELIEIRDETIILKEPVENYFELEKKKNKNGEFLVLNPKKTGNALSFITHHDKTETKNANSEESITGELTTAQERFAKLIAERRAKLGGAPTKLRKLNNDKEDFGDQKEKGDDMLGAEKITENPDLPKELDMANGINIDELDAILDSGEYAVLDPEKVKAIFGGKDGSDSSINLPKGMVETNMSVDELEDINTSGNYTMVDPRKFNDMFGAEDTSQVNFSDKKIAFINSLLQLSNKKNVDEKTRQRLVGLIGKELEKTGMLEDEILKEIKAMKEQLRGIKPEKYEPIPPNPKPDLPRKYIDPKGLSRFLLAYNQNPILKYTCHEIDDQEIIDNIIERSNSKDYDIIEHQKLIEDEFNKLTKEYWVNPKIKNLILVYLTGNSFSGTYTKWSSEYFDINWKSDQLFKWSQNNPGMVPNPGQNIANKYRNKGFKLEKAIRSDITNQRITTFAKLVIHFKHLFHIRGDNTLRRLIEIVNQNEGWNGRVDFEMKTEEFWDNLELFTDVDKLLQAYKSIIRMILEKAEIQKLNPPIVKLKFMEEGSHVFFSIHHRNSVFQRSISDILTRLGESHANLIKYQINGLCDLFLRADFGHKKYAEINLWNDNPRKETELSYFEGVEHILIFKK